MKKKQRKIKKYWKIYKKNNVRNFEVYDYDGYVLFISNNYIAPIILSKEIL